MTKKIVIDNMKNIKHMEFCIPTPGLHIVTGKTEVERLHYLLA